MTVFMVNVAQSVEPRIVIPVVVGSIPIVHPIFNKLLIHHRWPRPGPELFIINPATI